MPRPGFTMEVELGKIREFACATRSSNPAYLVAERPVSPATFLMSALFWSPGAGIGLDGRTIDGDVDLGRVLHGGQEFVFHGEPPRAGTRLVGRSRIDADYTKEGRRGGTLRFIEVVQEFRTTDGRPVADVRNTMIITSRPPAATTDAG
jgi:N-terminal half of MaoC dehydratase